MNDTDFLKALLAACAGATALQDADIQALAAALQDQVTGLGTAKGVDLSTPAAEAPASLSANWRRGNGNEEWRPRPGSRQALAMMRNPGFTPPSRWFSHAGDKA